MEPHWAARGGGHHRHAPLPGVGPGAGAVAACCAPALPHLQRFVHGPALTPHAPSRVQQQQHQQQLRGTLLLPQPSPPAIMQPLSLPPPPHSHPKTTAVCQCFFNYLRYWGGCWVDQAEERTLTHIHTHTLKKGGLFDAQSCDLASVWFVGQLSAPTCQLASAKLS